MQNTAPILKTLLTRGETADSMSISERTVSAIPRGLLPVVQIGRAVRYRMKDVELLTERLARGEVAIGPVNR